MKQRLIVWIVLGYITVLIWILWVKPQWGEQIFQWGKTEQQYRLRYDEFGEIKGEVRSIDRRQEGYQVRVKLLEGRDCILLLNEETTMQPGDQIWVQGKIWWPEAASNPGEWDAQLYARIHRFLFYCQPDQIQIVGRNVVSGRRWLFECRERMHEWIDATWDEPWSGMMQSILLGEKGALESEKKELFSEAGIAHIFAISGLHMMLLAESMTKILKRYQRMKVVKGEVAGILWGYALLSGAAVATVRTAVMLTIQAIAQITEREEEPTITLAVTAGILLVYQPLYLLDAGFWLSFTAILGLRFGQVWSMSLPLLPYQVRKRLSPSLAVTIATAPVSLYFFYQISTYGVLLNLWVIPAMGCVLQGGLAAALLSQIHPVLGKGLAVIPQLLLYSFEEGSRWLQRLPGAEWMRGCPTPLQMICFYGIWIGGILYWQKPESIRKKLVSRCCCGIACLLLLWRPSNWRITYLDVGQGDCAVVEWKDKVYMIDAGPNYEKVIKPFLAWRGIRHIDGIFLSHPDWDHIEGLLKLSEDPDLTIGYLWEARQAVQQTENRRALEQNIQKQGGVVQKLRAGDLVSAEGLTLRILSPKREYTNENDGSLVVEVSINDYRFLFTGDMTELVENEILGEIRSAVVLKVAHHGSKTASSEAFLQRVRPELAVISCDRKNRYGHPNEETLERLNQEQIVWLVTDDVGAVWVEGTPALRYVFYQKERTG